jgi:hypothetical protein
MSFKSCLKLTLIVLSFFMFFASYETKAASTNLEPKALFEKKCSKCHSIDKTNRTESKEWWTATVTKMKKKFFSGISDQDAAVITDYLIKTKTSPGAAPSAGKSDTPTK